VTFLLGTGPGILVLTVASCALVVGATWLVAVLLLAAFAAAADLVARLRGP
jgi:hypothetical protein